MRPFSFALALSVFLVAAQHAAADEVVWPRPQLPAGTPAAQFAVAPVEDDLFNHILQARSQQTDMILDGDSITDYFPGIGAPVFDKYYAPRHAIDFGISGNRTESVLWRLDHGQLDTLHPKLAMILIGVNNSGSPIEQVVAGVTKVVATYRAKCPDMHILLLGIFPHGRLPTDPMREMVRKTNALLAKLDDGQHVTFLDIGSKFLEPDGTISPEVMPDALHPALKGYEIWANAVEPVVEKYCPMPAPGARTAPVVAPTRDEVAASVPPMKWPFPMDPPPGTFSTVFPTYYGGFFEGFQYDLDLLKQGPYDLVFDGDGLTGDWKGRAPGLLQTRYGGIKLLNLGTYNNGVENILWRVRHGSLDGQNPKLIVLLAGLGNLGQNVKDVAGGMKLVLDEYKKRCPGAHIVLVSVLPNREDAQTRPWIDQLNALYAGLSDDRVTYLDVGARFRQPDGSVVSNLMPDHFDLSEKGYTVWANAMQPIIDKYLPGAGGK
jgi:lysophospholipase L1-like esterase